MSHIWQLGYGTVTSESMIGWNFAGGQGLLLTILIANSPQLLLSFLFLTYNGMFTCMRLTEEWMGYAHERKPLRVTDPVGAQRSTYRLQLPYRYGIPMLILSGILHWLVSQSLFLARIIAIDANGNEDAAGSISTVGYSCIAIITVIPVGVIVVLIGIITGLRRYRSGMPLAVSCSAAISAACQRPDGDVDAAIKPVMWGAISQKVKWLDEEGRAVRWRGTSTEGLVGHCCFTSFEVSPPVEGKLYA